MRREYLAGSTNFETFMGHNNETDTQKVGQNLRKVFGHSDALMNSQADGQTMKANFIGQPRVEMVSPKRAMKKPEIFITDIEEEDEDQDSSSSSIEEKSLNLISKIQ
jgi:hypothetical protein